MEGGSAVIGSFCDAKLVDEAYFFIAPKIIGGEKAKSAIGGVGISTLPLALSFENITVRKIGTDILLHVISR